MADTTMRRKGSLKLEKRLNFLYPVGMEIKQYPSDLGDGYVAHYKLHITLSEETYDRDCEFVMSFLHQYNHKFKMVSPSDMSELREEHAFTIYPEREGELLDVIAGIMNLQRDLEEVYFGVGLTAGSPSGNGWVVPGTNGLFTYEVERINRKIADDMNKSHNFDPYFLKRSVGLEGVTPSKGPMLKSDGLTEHFYANLFDHDNGYIGKEIPKLFRLEAMKFLFGRGPLDFLWSEDINTELPPPPEPKKRGLRKTKPGPPHNKNNHFNGNATVLDKNNKPTKRVRRLDPKVRPGSIKDPVCSYCLDKMREKHDSPDKILRDGRPPAFLFIVQDQSWKEYSPSKLPGIKERVEAIMKIIPPFTKYLTGSHIRPITAGPILWSEYSKITESSDPNIGPVTGLDWEKIQSEYPQLTHYPEAYTVTVVRIGSSPPNAYATTTSLNFNKNFTPKEWGVIYAHELGHDFGNTGFGLYEKYHKWKGPGDKHCPYNCLFHHYMSCGNIADGNEEAVYDTFVRPRPRRTN